MNERTPLAALNPLDHPICLETPRRLTPFSAWAGHIPFAMLLVDLMRPRVIVELGVYYGDSFFAFCQAAQESGHDCDCFAIDSWKGDTQLVYDDGPEVLADVQAHRDAYYSGFAHVIRRRFDEELSRFADGEIDLLHIDGDHGYEAVRHDFEGWLPKMSAHGVILLHDTQVRERSFGVWKLWSELTSRFASFEFLHGHGLGVLLVGSYCPPSLAPLFDATPQETVHIRELFAALGERLELRVRVARQETRQHASLKEDLAMCMRHLARTLRGRAAGLVGSCETLGRKGGIFRRSAARGRDS